MTTRMFAPKADLLDDAATSGPIKLEEQFWRLKTNVREGEDVRGYPSFIVVNNKNALHLRLTFMPYSLLQMNPCHWKNRKDYLIDHSWV